MRRFARFILCAPYVDMKYYEAHKECRAED